MYGLGIDLTDLEKKSDELLESMDAKIDQVDDQLPELQVRDYLARLAEEFTERPFEPLSEIWERELRDLFNDDD
jgi:hypothetical protein